MSNFDLPAAFEEFADARKAGFLKVKAAKEQNKKVAGCFCAFTPLEILDAGKVPFYCAAWSNIKSVRNAIRCGFRPAWVQVTAKTAEYVDKMNAV